MSQENVEAHERVIGAFNRRDLPALLAGMDERVEAVGVDTVVEGAFHGHEGLRPWWDGLVGAFPDWRIEIVQLRDLGEVSLAVLRGHGHGAASAMPLEVSVWHPARWQNGKCIWWATFQAEAEALEAVGLSE